MYGVPYSMICQHKFLNIRARISLGLRPDECPSSHTAVLICTSVHLLTQPISFPQRDCTAVWLLTSR